MSAALYNCPGCKSRIPAALVQTSCPVCNAPVMPESRTAGGPIVAPPERELVAGEVRGWRAWNVHKLGKLYRLGSVTHKSHWPVADWVYAHCGGDPVCDHPSNTDGRVPGEGCSCGIYSASTFEQLVKELPYAHYQRAGEVVIGEIAMAGKVIVGTQGYRAEKARVAKIYTPPNAWKLGREIAKQYGVEYDTHRWIG